MAIGDTQYQVNDLLARVKTLETQAKASTAVAIPAAPLTVATSTGQGIAGIGVSQDSVSRSISTAIQSAFSGVESLQFAQTAFGTTIFPTPVPTNAFTFNIRPDPVVGDVYRCTFGGVITNASGGPITFAFTTSLPGSTAVPLLNPVKPSGPGDSFFCMFLIICVAAGNPGNAHIISDATAGYFNIGSINPPQNFARAQGMGAALNLVNPNLTIDVSASASDPTVAFAIEFLTLESLGSRTG